MKSLFVLGTLLTVVGIGILIFEGISYTRDETVLDVGPVEAQVEERETIEFSPLVGGAVTLVGVGLLIFARQRKV